MFPDDFYKNETVVLGLLHRGLAIQHIPPKFWTLKILQTAIKQKDQTAKVVLALFKNLDFFQDKKEELMELCKIGMKNMKTAEIDEIYLDSLGRRYRASTTTICEKIFQNLTFFTGMESTILSLCIEQVKKTSPPSLSVIKNQRISTELLATFEFVYKNLSCFTEHKDTVLTLWELVVKHASTLTSQDMQKLCGWLTKFLELNNFWSAQQLMQLCEPMLTRGISAFEIICQHVEKLEGGKDGLFASCQIVMKNECDLRLFVDVLSSELFSADQKRELCTFMVQESLLLYGAADERFFTEDEMRALHITIGKRMPLELFNPSCTSLFTQDDWSLLWKHYQEHYGFDKDAETFRNLFSDFEKMVAEQAFFLSQILRTPVNTKAGAVTVLDIPLDVLLNYFKDKKELLEIFHMAINASTQGYPIKLWKEIFEKISMFEGLEDQLLELWMLSVNKLDTENREAVDICSMDFSYIVSKKLFNKQNVLSLCETMFFKAATLWKIICQYSENFDGLEDQVLELYKQYPDSSTDSQSQLLLEKNFFKTPERQNTAYVLMLENGSMKTEILKNHSTYFNKQELLALLSKTKEGNRLFLTCVKQLLENKVFENIKDGPFILCKLLINSGNVDAIIEHPIIFLKSYIPENTIRELCTRAVKERLKQVLFSLLPPEGCFAELFENRAYEIHELCKIAVMRWPNICFDKRFPKNVLTKENWEEIGNHYLREGIPVSTNATIFFKQESNEKTAAIPSNFSDTTFVITHTLK